MKDKTFFLRKKISKMDRTITTTEIWSQSNERDLCGHFTRHFDSYKPGKLRRTRHKGRNGAVKSIQVRLAGQYKKCVQYGFKFTPVYGLSINLANMYTPLNSQWNDFLVQIKSNFSNLCCPMHTFLVTFNHYLYFI